MKSKINKISSLSEDIQMIIKESHGENFDMLRLCKDHSNPVLLFNKKPVLEILQNDLIGVFDMGLNHYFLSPEQVFRLALFCKLPMPGIIALVLKAEWEINFSEMLNYYSLGNKTHLVTLIKDNKIIVKYISEFNPDKGKITNQFVKFVQDQENDFQIDHIEYIILDLIKENNFLRENKWIRNQDFCIKTNEKMLLLNSTEAEREKYNQLKELWKYRTDELSEFLFLLERKKRVFINLENKYLRSFGDLEFKKLRLLNNVEKYAAVLKLKENNPEMSYRELIRMVTDVHDEAVKEKSELKSKINRSNTILDLSFFAGTKSAVTEEFKRSYISECKKLLRKLYLILHPDRPFYSSLNKSSKKRINELWLKLMKTTNNELYSYSPTVLLYQYPDLNVLENLYLKACDILGMTPDNVEPGDHLEFMISKGTPLLSIMDFLSSEIQKTEVHLAHLELIQYEYTHEYENQFYRTAMEDEQGHKEKLLKEISRLKEQIHAIKKEISKSLVKTEV